MNRGNQARCVARSARCGALRWLANEFVPAGLLAGALAVAIALSGCVAVLWGGAFSAACNDDWKFEKPCASDPAGNLHDDKPAPDGLDHGR